jgi:hypothetical protein
MDDPASSRPLHTLHGVLHIVGVNSHVIGNEKLKNKSRMQAGGMAPEVELPT